MSHRSEARGVHEGLTTHDVECETVRELTYDIKPGALLT